MNCRSDNQLDNLIISFLQKKIYSKNNNIGLNERIEENKTRQRKGSLSTRGSSNITL